MGFRCRICSTLLLLHFTRIFRVMHVNFVVYSWWRKLDCCPKSFIKCCPVLDWIWHERKFLNPVRGPEESFQVWWILSLIRYELFGSYLLLVGETGLVVQTSLLWIVKCPKFSWIEEWLGGMLEQSWNLVIVIDKCFNSSNLLEALLDGGVDSFWRKISLPMKPEIYSMFHYLCKEL